MLKPKRILLKISWEMLSWKDKSLFDKEKIFILINQLKKIFNAWFEIVVICWAWNIWRYNNNKSFSFDRVKSDTIWMIWTIINAGIISESFNKKTWLDSVIYTPNWFRNWELTINFNSKKAKQDLKNWKIIFCAWGTWSPYFTTDTAAALRAAELNCDIILKATKVDWIYDKDPIFYKNAKKFDEISFDNVIKLWLKVMDQSAFVMCKENNINIIVFKMTKNTDLVKILHWDLKNASLIK